MLESASERKVTSIGVKLEDVQIYDLMLFAIFRCQMASVPTSCANFIGKLDHSTLQRTRVYWSIYLPYILTRISYQAQQSLISAIHVE